MGLALPIWLQCCFHKALRNLDVRCVDHFNPFGFPCMKEFILLNHRMYKYEMVQPYNNQQQSFTEVEKSSSLSLANLVLPSHKLTKLQKSLAEL